MVEDMQGTPAATDVAGLSQRMTYFVMTVRQDTNEIYGRLDDAHDDSDTARSEVRALRTIILAQQAEIGALRAADRTRQAQLKMEPKRTTRSTLATTTTPTTSMTDAQLKALIDQGVANALAARDAYRCRNGEDSQDWHGCKEASSSCSMETVFRISNCTVENQIKFATCTLLGSALTWWNAHVRTIGHDVTYAMTWTNLKKTMADKYYPRGEIMKLEDAIKFATELMDKKIRTFVERQSENKRKQNDNQQQQYNKRQNTGRVYAAGSGLKPTCYECGAQGHLERDCLKLKNNNHGNQVGNGNAPAKVYAVGRAGKNLDSNVVMGMFLLNNRYASILFDTGVDRSFVSTAFSSQIDITPSTLDHYYDVELADGRIIGLNAIIQGCTLNLLNHPFNIDLMPVELGSLDVIIGMDWLAKYQAVIVCAEKIVRIP
ncbi:reverse transcriptase domain-containing protein [Tanacetum coccineum]